MKMAEDNRIFIPDSALFETPNSEGRRHNPLGRSSGFRIVLLAAPYHRIDSGLLAAIVPGYSGGTATDFHRLPFSPAQAGTLRFKRRGQ